MSHHFYIHVILLSFVLSFFLGTDSYAANREPLYLTPDKTEILYLDEDAASVIVSNPAHARVALDTARIMLISPAMPGTTEILALNSDGKVILRQRVIVTSKGNDYVRVRRACSNGGDTCLAESYYYCDGTCHHIQAEVPVAASGGSEGDGGPAGGGAPPPVPPTDMAAP